MSAQIRRGEYRFKGAADARDGTPGLRCPHLSGCDCAACRDYWRGYIAAGGEVRK